MLFLFYLSSYCRAIEAVNREYAIWRLEVRSEKKIPLKL